MTATPHTEAAGAEHLARCTMRLMAEPSRILTVRRSIDLVRTASGLCR